MKVIALFIGVAVLLIAAFFTWFFLVFLKVPTLEIPASATMAERAQHTDKWFELLEKEHRFNGSVLIAKDGKVLLSKGYGYTDHTKASRLTKDSSMRLASVSKQFTAAGILVLQEQGKLSLDDAVTDYIPELPYPGVTLRHLLNQTSGIPDIYIALAEANKATIPLLTNQIAVDLLISEARTADSKPNEVFSYSNTNYILLARIAEIITGMSFEDFMRTSLFEPLGMHNTRVWNLTSSSADFENKASDFLNFAGHTKASTPTFIDGVAGDGAVFSSSADMLIWNQFWNSNTLVSETALKEAFERPILNDGTVSNYGFGWIISNEGMWHDGRWLGANTLINRNVQEKTTFVILDNSTNIFFDKIIEQVQRAGLL